MFRSHVDLASHIRPIVANQNKNEGPPSTYYCVLCIEDDNEAFGYDSETEVEVHKQVHHKMRFGPYIITESQRKLCFICAIMFETREELVSHVKTAHLYSSENALRVERNIYICDICHKVYFHKGILRFHLEYEHNFNKDSKKILCPHCHNYKSTKCMWHHFTNIGFKSISSCPICFKRQANRTALLAHVATHPHFFKCEVCQFECVHHQVFTNHVTNCHGAVEEIKLSDVTKYFVGVKFPNIWTYKVQFPLSGLYIYGMLYICILCRHICAEKKEMHTHIASVHIAVPKREIKVEKKCSCGEVFPSMILLKHHMFKTSHAKNDDIVEKI